MQRSGMSPDKFVWQVPFLPFLSATVKHEGRDESREGGILVSYHNGMLSITALDALHQHVLVLCLPVAVSCSRSCPRRAS